METFVIVALLAVALLGAELLLPTGGVLAALGATGLVVGGILALDSNNSEADVIGPALITLGVLSGATFYIVARKVLAAHRDQPVRGGPEELIGALAEARSSIDPSGQVAIEGALWKARLANGSAPAQMGDRVTVEAVDGLTLVVRAEPRPADTRKGADS